MPMLDRPNEDPPVRMTPTDYDRLSVLCATAHTLGSEMLSQELDRAFVVRADGTDQPFVHLHSQVEYLDLPSGRTRTLEVVPPEEADIDRGRVSVLSPVGAALIGLAAGDSYRWTGEDGRSHVLVVVDVGGAHVGA
jgi:regulator of nucleoside diphosphate kinase